MESDPTRTAAGAPPGATRRIGAYKLMTILGEGGMGVVYEALQEEPVRRTVAVKLIKRGMDSKSVIARFESERQALALMSHPNIARVLDAGESEDGQPLQACNPQSIAPYRSSPTAFVRTAKPLRIDALR